MNRWIKRDLGRGEIFQGPHQFKTPNRSDLNPDSGGKERTSFPEVGDGRVPVSLLRKLWPGAGTIGELSELARAFVGKEVAR
jgi:hypothetical protein